MKNSAKASAVKGTLQSTGKLTLTELIIDVLYATVAGIIVGVAYFFFQNSNGFAPGGVGGLATITHHIITTCGGTVNWGIIMILFNLPIFILVSALVNKKLGFMLSIYLCVLSFLPNLFTALNIQPYSLASSGKDFNILIAAIATGVLSGLGFAVMLRRFGASGGTYGISAIIKKARPATNVAYVSFIMDSIVVSVSFFVYGMKVTPVVCTLINQFIASIIVDRSLNGIKNGYKFEIITNDPAELSQKLMDELKHGVTEIQVKGLHSNTDKYMLICIVNKRQIGDMMKIIKQYPDTFASFEKVNEVFGNFNRRV